MVASTNSVNKRNNLLGIFFLSLLILSITPGSFAAKKRAPRLSFSANPKVIKAGSPLLFKGRLLDRLGHSQSGRVVVLQRKSVRYVTKKIKGKNKKAKQYFWRNLGSKRTNRHGIYSFKHRPKKSATYKVRVLSSRGRKKPPATSPPVVSPQVTIIVTSGPMTGRLGFAVGNKFVWLSDQELSSRLDDMASIGVKWIRHDMPWNVIQPDNSTSYNWSMYDRLVLEANKRNIKILPILTYTPRWARVPAAINSDFSAPADPAQFATYAANAAKRYAPLGIHVWEIWNEPNLAGSWEPAANVSAYTDLLKKSYVSIKQVDPSATIVSGGLSPAETLNGKIAPLDFVSGMYANGAKNYFDVLGHHPYSYPALPSSFYSWSAWSQMSDTSRSIRSIMTSYGDSSKTIWATEFGVPTNGSAPWLEPNSISESLQANSIDDALRQMQDKTWLQMMFIYSYKDLSNDPSTIENFFGVIRYDGSFKPAYYSVKNILSN